MTSPRWTPELYARLIELDGGRIPDEERINDPEALEALGGMFPDLEAAAEAFRAMSRRRRPWTEEDLEVLRERYPHERTQDLARELGRPINQVYAKANRDGLRKTAEYMASPAACPLRRGGDDHPGKATQFKPGHVPWTKGRKGYDAGGRSHETRFKVGQVNRKWVPPGTHRVDGRDGYLWIKVADSGSFVDDWKQAHVLLWEIHHGAVPDGHVIAFRDGDKTNVTIDNLECVSRAEMMKRNTIHRYPEELKNVIHLRGRLKRGIRRKEENHGEEQDGGPAQSPIPGARAAERR